MLVEVLIVVIIVVVVVSVVVVCRGSRGRRRRLRFSRTTIEFLEVVAGLFWDLSGVSNSFIMEGCEGLQQPRVRAGTSQTSGAACRQRGDAVFAALTCHGPGSLGSSPFHDITAASMCG